MIVKPDDQVIDYVIYQMKIRKAEQEKPFVDLMQVLERRSKP
jgi:hypothetical protein